MIVNNVITARIQDAQSHAKRIARRNDNTLAILSYGDWFEDLDIPVEEVRRLLPSTMVVSPKRGDTSAEAELWLWVRCSE